MGWNRGSLGAYFSGELNLEVRPVNKISTSNGSSVGGSYSEMQPES